MSYFFPTFQRLFHGLAELASPLSKDPQPRFTFISTMVSSLPRRKQYYIRDSKSVVPEIRAFIHDDLGCRSLQDYKLSKELDLALTAFLEEHGELDEQFILIETPEWYGYFIHEKGARDRCIILRYGFPDTTTPRQTMA